jgi:hypothetical protein
MALAQMRNLISQRKGRFLRLLEKDLDATGAAKDKKLTAEISPQRSKATIVCLWRSNDYKRPSLTLFRRRVDQICALG